MIRDQLGEIPAGTELLRRVRYLRDPDLADLTVDEIRNAARWLRAAGYSAHEGARRLDRYLSTITTTTEQEPDTCSPSPHSPTTPPATDADPGSPSISTTTPPGTSS